MKECKKCESQKEEIEFTDQNGLHNVCNKCRGSLKKPVVVVPEKVSDKPVSVKTTTPEVKKVVVPTKKVVAPAPKNVPVPEEPANEGPVSVREK